ncbi:unnamed protein product [Cuscuta europaea]|uniref:Uncharacterized protein n=1 Tax=Cuscuta europaea TaxID=41803 RepID=A0A9P0ZCB0_CUSEU|nr:unnamed protein product [Cuscuta europaea]
MDHPLRGLPETSINRFELENEVIFPTVEQSLGIPDNDTIHGLSTHSPSLDCDPMLDYICQILLEEDSVDGNNDNMFFDPIALTAAEKSFYEALRGNPSSPFYTNDIDLVESKSSVTYDLSYDVDSVESILSATCDHPDFTIQPSSRQTNLDELNGASRSLHSLNLVPNIFCDQTESILKLKRGVKVADKYGFPTKAKSDLIPTEKGQSAELCRGRKHYHPDEIGWEERRSKQSAVYKEEAELSEVFDKVLLCTDDNDSPSRVGCPQQKGRSGRKSHSKKRRDNYEVVDLESLLTSCAQSVAANDYRAAEDKLKKVRQHSSPSGDANQRLANIFADSLEARLAGTGAQLYAALSPNNIIITETLKSYLSCLPFTRLSILFANNMIYEVASEVASLHVIDFGILYGIQWPTLIRDLSHRPGGPPKLRITGIDLPQPGFRPSQMLEETGCRLAKYCERFGVPFEYNFIMANNWETLKTAEFKLVKGEVVAVNCIDRLEHLLDETVVIGESPKDAVLNLIREVNPHIFVQSVRSGAHNSPFFLTRFREAVSFYSAVFDMSGATLPSHGNERSNFEQQFLKRDIINIIACEGMERLVRPNTYKQWHSHMMRVGFKPLSINPELMKKYMCKVREGYHKDFLFAQDGHWIIQGWKGRIFGGTSCWVSAQRTHNL